MQNKYINVHNKEKFNIALVNPKAIISTTIGLYTIDKKAFIDKDYQARLYKIKEGNKDGRVIAEFPFHNVEYIEYLS